MAMYEKGKRLWTKLWRTRYKLEQKIFCQVRSKSSNVAVGSSWFTHQSSVAECPQNVAPNCWPCLRLISLVSPSRAPSPAHNPFHNSFYYLFIRPFDTRLIYHITNISPVCFIALHPQHSLQGPAGWLQHAMLVCKFSNPPTASRSLWQCRLRCPRSSPKLG